MTPREEERLARQRLHNLEKARRAKEAKGRAEEAEARREHKHRLSEVRKRKRAAIAAYDRAVERQRDCMTDAAWLNAADRADRAQSQFLACAREERYLAESGATA